MSRDFEVVDGYIHCGLSKYEPVEVVRDVMLDAEVDRAVLVQHLGEFDNSYLAGVISADPRTFAGVCMVDEKSERAEADLEALAAEGIFRGIRIPGWTIRAAPKLVGRAADLGFVVMFYGREGTAEYLDELRTLIEPRPDCRLVLTHLANPPRPEESAYARHEQVLALAEHPGVFFQLSGMGMRTPYPHVPYYPLIERAVEAFGTERLIWGSNYPPIGAAEDVAKDVHLLLDGDLPVPADAVPAVAGGNALRLWWGQ